MELTRRKLDILGRVCLQKFDYRNDHGRAGYLRSLENLIKRLMKFIFENFTLVTQLYHIIYMIIIYL